MARQPRLLAQFAWIAFSLPPMSCADSAPGRPLTFENDESDGSDGNGSDGNESDGTESYGTESDGTESDGAEPTTCLSDEAIDQDLTNIRSRLELSDLGDAWIAQCPTSSKAWITRARLLQRASLSAALVRESAAMALELDSDWDTAEPADAHALLALGHLMRKEFVNAVEMAQACQGSLRNGALCDEMLTLANVQHYHIPSGVMEGDGNICGEDNTIYPHPSIGYIAQAHMFYELGEKERAHEAARQCVSWIANGEAAPPLDDNSPYEPISESGNDICPLLYSEQPSETLDDCLMMLNLTPPPVVVVDGDVPDPIEENGDFTVMLGAGYGVAVGLGVEGVQYSYGVGYVIDHHGNTGWAITLFGGVGPGVSFGGFAGGAVSISTASSILALEGWSPQVSFSTITQPFGGGVDLFWTNDYWGFAFELGLAGGAGFSVAPGESYTFIFPDPW